MFSDINLRGGHSSSKSPNNHNHNHGHSHRHPMHVPPSPSNRSTRSTPSPPPSVTPLVPVSLSSATTANKPRRFSHNRDRDQLPKSIRGGGHNPGRNKLEDLGEGSSTAAEGGRRGESSTSFDEEDTESDDDTEESEKTEGEGLEDTQNALRLFPSNDSRSSSPMPFMTSTTPTSATFSNSSTALPLSHTSTPTLSAHHLPSSDYPKRSGGLFSQAQTQPSSVKRRLLSPAPSRSARRPYSHGHSRSERNLFPTVLPIYLGKRRWRTKIDTRVCEATLLLGAMALALYKLAMKGEWGSVKDHVLLTTLSLLYLRFRPLPDSTPPPRPSSPNLDLKSNHSTSATQRRTFPSLSESPSSPSSSPALPNSNFPTGIDPPTHTIPNTKPSPAKPQARGEIHGTSSINYRDASDDGALMGLLLGPLLSSGALFDALNLKPTNWRIEGPPFAPKSTPGANLDATQVLGNLVKSRRTLTSITSMLGVCVLIQLGIARWAEVHRQKRAWSKKLQTTSSNSHGGKRGGHSSHGNEDTMKRWPSEWKRNGSVILFAFSVSGTLAALKGGMKYFAPHLGVWEDLSVFDTFCASAFHQFSLYCCVRLAKKGFTLGELTVVAQFSTVLFMETVNISRARLPINLLTTSYTATFRTPTPLLIFQLALIPGSFLTGMLLSPLLVLSRYISQKPSHRLRFPEEKTVHRRYLAASFYAGTVIIVGGGIGMWTKWLLKWRDPWLWALKYVFSAEGKGGAKARLLRLGLLGWWGLLAVLSVGGLERQLVKARKNRPWVTVGGKGVKRGEIVVVGPPQVVGEPMPISSPTNASNTQPHTSSLTSSLLPPGGSPFSMHSSEYPPPPPSTHTVTPSSTLNSANTSTPGTGHFVNSPMMDAAANRVPVLSLNGRRKYFHGLAVFMFTPGIFFDPAFTHLAFSFAFACFIFAEYIRYFALYPFGAAVHLFLNEFLDHKDSGTAILSHFYLLTGCALGLWLESPEMILGYIGILTLGVGDAVASIVGRSIGRIKWSPESGRTVEGSVAYFGATMLFAIGLRALGMVDQFSYTKLMLTLLLSSLLEALSSQNDNLILPIYTWSVGSILGLGV